MGSHPAYTLPGLLRLHRLVVVPSNRSTQAAQLHTHHSNISNTVTCRQEEGLLLVLVLVVAGRRGAGPSAGWPAVRRLWRLLPPSSISAVRWWPCRGAHCVTLSRYVTLCHVMSRCSHQWSPGHQCCQRIIGFRSLCVGLAGDWGHPNFRVVCSVIKLSLLLGFSCRIAR